MVTSLDSINADFIRAQLGAAYDRYSAEERSQHATFLRTLQRPEDVVVHTEERSSGWWRVTVCASDYVGALSIIAGLFTAYRMNIVNADIFTLHLERQREVPQRRRTPLGQIQTSRRVVRRPVRKLLDLFEVQALEAARREVWDRFRDDLTQLFALLATGQPESARDQVIDRVSETIRGIRGGAGPLFPVTVTLDNEASPSFTRLSIHSLDTLGFLFEFTNALAVLHVNIERAEVRTIAGDAHDIFWVANALGDKIVEEARIHELRVAAVLIKHFTHLLPRAPDPAQALRQFSALIRQLLSRPDWTAQLSDLESQDVLTTLAELMGVSRFLWEDFLRMQHENLFPVLVDTPSLDERKQQEHLRAALRQQRARLTTQSERVEALNRFKDREMFRIDLRHITGRIGFQEFSEELTELAEVVVEEAAALFHEALGRQVSDTLSGDGPPSPWCICGLGKFGGRELGFGSDVELLFIYDDGAAASPTKSLRTAQYFEEFVRVFMTSIKAPHEGIFQIDLRLRPYGEAGALACSLAGFKEYYSETGAAHQFERMALVKLRPIAGDPSLGRKVEQVRDAYVYSGRPLDLENIRYLRHRQATELVPSGTLNAKYSPGGLVDIEYFVQARQILVGSTDVSVRVTNTLDAIDRLTEAGDIQSQQAEDLRLSYRFLRRLIDALRVVRGHARDLTLPAADSREFAYLVRRLQYGSAAQLHQAITEHMAVARRLWWEEGGQAGP